jgi:hypothetical protein
MPNPAQVRHKKCSTRRPAGNADWISAQTTPVPPGGGSAGGHARRARGVVDHLVPTARHLLDRVTRPR